MSDIRNKTTTCYHCGEDCGDEPLQLDGKSFCCQGCQMVYGILNLHDLCQYYSIDKTPGISQKVRTREGKFACLDDPSVESKLLQYADGQQKHVVFYLPQMHCSSCIWLLEHMHQIDANIIQSQVQFLKKEIRIVYDAKKTNLREVAELLASIGYEPHISLHDLSTKHVKSYDEKRIYRIGVAGFCFGNIMMLSFPEYFSFGAIEEKGLAQLFSYLNLGLSLPVFFYSASEFFVSAWKSLRQKFLNIDAPIALAIIITFARSVYEILSHHGAGYLDSMSGIVFFMLVGRFFQDRTYQSLSFDRDYTSYFPLGISVIGENGQEKQIPVSELKTGQRIRIHHDEIIPADAILFLGKASIDYSFVTGESLPVEKSIGEIVYAGGRQTAGAIELEVVKEVSQSYLTQLWNNDVFRDAAPRKVSFIHHVSNWFTYVLFSIALITGIYWQVTDASKTWSAVTAILIVACPCALLLSATFTNGNMLRVLQKHLFYARNADIIENLAEADSIVFDKTGTITRQGDCHITYTGATLSPEEEQLIRSMANQSGHPLSKAIVSFLPFSRTLPVRHYHDIKGKGASGLVGGQQVKLGSAAYITGTMHGQPADGSKVYVAVNNEVLGCFVVKNTYRKGLKQVMRQLANRYHLSLISGDNEAERDVLLPYFGSQPDLRFHQSPQDKLNYISHLQEENHRVIMVGDGLNDAGALKKSQAGIVITDDVNNFSPACDAILDGKSFSKLPAILRYCRKHKVIIYGSFIISIVYNIVGLSFAVQGTLQPVIAAILMPVSSINIVLFTTSLSTLFSIGLKRADKSHVTG